MYFHCMSMEQPFPSLDIFIFVEIMMTKMHLEVHGYLFASYVGFVEASDEFDTRNPFILASWVMFMWCGSAMLLFPI